MVFGYTCRYITCELPRILKKIISIIISQLRYHYISLDQASRATSVVAKYLDTAKIRENSFFFKDYLTS